MDRARTALGDEASIAASQQIAQLQDLIPKLKRYAPQIVKSPELRRATVQIARSLGLDEFQLQLAGSLPNEFRHRIEVTTIEVCREMQVQQGSSISLISLADRVSDRLGRNVTTGDIERAIEDLEVFGPGLKLELLNNGEQIVRSDVSELSNEQGEVLVACDALGYVTVDMLTFELSWDKEIALSVLQEMVQKGMLWVDTQVVPTEYWTLP